MTDNEEKRELGKPAVAVVKKDDEYNVVLPCDVKDFREFVSGLLGAQQISEGDVEGVFDITEREVSNIYHLVVQRVSRQNEATLMHLSLSVHYDDGTSVTHNSVEEFEKYYPTEPCHPIGVNLKFTYLIKFQDRNVPEKQEIDVAVIAEPQKYRDKERLSKYYHSGVFNYRVSHTERTWASDISGLLKKHAKTFVGEKNKLKEYIAQSTSELTTYLFVLIMSISVYFWANYTTTEISNQNTNIDTSYFVWSTAIFFILGLLIYGIKEFSDYNLFPRRLSFIVLTDKDKVYRNDKKRKEINQWLKYIASWLISIAIGVYANMIYHYISLPNA